MILRCLLLLLPLLLGACSSSEESKAPPVMSQKMADRIASSRKRMGDMNDRSIYDRGMNSSITKGKDTGGWLGKKSYGSKEYSGTRNYAKSKDVKTGSYTRSDDQSRLGRQGFAQAGQTAGDMTGDYKTGQSRFANDAAREGAQSFDGGNSVYKTGAQRDALRSQEKNDRPKFIRLDDNEKKPAYTEQQVRSLLGRS